MSTQALSVALPSDIIYVSGSVNGVDCTWTLNGGAWETVADRSDDEAYHVLLTAVNGLGVSSEFDFTLYYGFLHLITDRAREDVNFRARLAAKGWAGMTAEEQSQWLGRLKGAYNDTDMNRVGGAMNQLATVLSALPDQMLDYLASKGVAPDAAFRVPYDPDTLDWTQKVTWQVDEIPTPGELELYLRRVTLLRNSMDYETDPLPSTMEGLDYIGANAIEKALVLLDPTIAIWTAQTKQAVDRTAQAWFFAGDVFAGEI